MAVAVPRIRASFLPQGPGGRGGPRGLKIVEGVAEATLKRFEGIRPAAAESR